MLIKCTEKVGFFAEMLYNQEADKHEECCKAMGYKYGELGETIVKEGSVGQTFYILLKGSVGIYKSEPVDISMSSFNNFNEENGKLLTKNSGLLKKPIKRLSTKKSQILENFNEEKLNKIKVLKAGEAFGELSLIDNRPRAASVICEGECHLAILEKQFFDRILSNFLIF